MAKDVVLQVAGHSHTPSLAGEIMIEVHSEGEWVYVEVIDRCVQVWSGAACARCKATAAGLQRCVLHANVMSIAMQMKLL